MVLVVRIRMVLSLMIVMDDGDCGKNKDGVGY